MGCELRGSHVLPVNQTSITGRPLQFYLAEFGMIEGPEKAPSSERFQAGHSGTSNCRLSSIERFRYNDENVIATQQPLKYKKAQFRP